MGSKKKEIFLPSPIDWVDRNIVKVEDGFIVFDPTAEQDLRSLLKIKEKVDQCLEIVKSTIARQCLGNEKYNCDSELVNVSFTPSRSEMKFQAAKFKKEHPELYNKYCVETEVKPAIRMSIKKENVKPSLVYADSYGIVHGLEKKAGEKERGEGDLEVVANNKVGAEDE